MRLGGYVLHRDNKDTLEPCLRGLLALCDDVVALDSGATDGSGELARSLGARSVPHSWKGYGAARVAAVNALAPCDYVFYLDSDESLEPGAVDTLRAWKGSSPDADVYRLPRRDWAEVEGRRFLFRTQWRARLVRREKAVWHARHIVHEALPKMRGGRVLAPIDHRFATSVARRCAKEERYALMWALRAHFEQRRLKPVVIQRLAAWVRDCVLTGAVFRGGADASRLAWGVAGYHSTKYAYLRQLREGRFAELARIYSEERYDELFARVREGRLD
ncbi:glycosyltransferase family 2 protein [Myxococcus llanfairpwllgwyngyllgogerychwyrndrobwllllantysiliogogogochensis]|uniref:Glycosyltransferase family 2 protein n=1 Tax=Myxococcus llanfairpwllgwyngyllgogerychwyrndrobwllllantysiliogogogochensis TaxID=2590453 RepID=A0A540X7S1_9BACT|nr:glycosyltransferase family 2 protein [Myxococcus llanfairpwllgwyngyllgogerychwyrndrobwllllantysiliogogogochensis]TQF17351.1 glycosyltransferase family 2 protein [Myxococcus llanfairpwllgwyngyllgogerychwyrndrobwllllantysiliogogogochensis]